MYNNNKWFFIIFKALFVLIAGYGLYLHSGPGKWSSFNYYTVLSNLVCFLYFAVSLGWNIVRLSHSNGVSTYRPRLEGAVTFCITVTFLIYHFILRPEAFRMDSDQYSFWNPSNMISHYIVPLMTIADWLIFCPKGRWRGYDPALWLLIPLSYFVYIIFRAPIAGNIGNTQSPYPYSFIDVQQLGWAAVLTNVAVIAAAMALLGYVIYFTDRGLARLGRKR